MSKPSASNVWIYVLCAIIAIALFVLSSAHQQRALGSTSAGSSASQPAAAARGRVQASYAALPLAFEPNQGQTDSQVQYLARGNGYTLFLTANDAVFSLHSHSAAGKSSDVSVTARSHARNPGHPSAQKDSTAVVRMQLQGSNSQAKVSARGQLPGTSNYFLGNDASKWHSGVARYARVSYQDVYPGVNLAFYGAQRQLEFDFVVAPGANPASIAFRITGNQGLKTDDSGNLLISSTAGDVLLHKPVAYQEQNGARQPVDARFSLQANNQIAFELGNYDHSRELVIDPSVSYAYSTYLGGSTEDDGFGIAFDNSGNAYVTGKTQSVNFPILGGVLPNAHVGGFDVFVTKIAASGSSLAYSTYVGGSGDDSGNAIAVDRTTGSAFVAGGTSSSDFPTTPSAFRTKYVSGAASNAFVFELNPAGDALTYSTLLGGSIDDVARGVALDGSGNAYVVGLTSSSDFPTSNPLQTYPGVSNNAFVTELNSSGSALVYSTYLALGGTINDTANGVVLDSSANAYVVGTASTGSGAAAFHTTPGAFQTTNNGISNVFVTVIKTSGTGYVYSTFLGGSGTDVGVGIAVDSSGSAYVTGSTTSNKDFPTTASSLQRAYQGGTADAFVTKLNPAGSALVYSTYLGGSGFDAGAGIALDGNNNAYVTGQTNSPAPTFPTAHAIQNAPGGGYDAFVSELNFAGSQLGFSTYLGGLLDEDVGATGAIAVDGAGASIYVTGNTDSANFPTHAPYPYAGGSVNGGGIDAFVAKYTQTTFDLTATTLGAVAPGTSATSTVTLTAVNGYSGSVGLACNVSGSGSPLPACSASSFSPPGPIPPTSGGAATTLTITTTGPTASQFHPAKFFYAMWLPVVGLSLVGVSFRSARSRSKKLLGFLMLGVIMAALFLLPACGGGGHGGGGGGGGTPAGAYTVTITGTGNDAATTTQTVQVTLTVN